MVILGKRTTNLVRQASCIALLVLAVLHCAPVVQAQTDNSCLAIERQQLRDPRIPAWILEGECEAAKAEAAERGISVEQAFAEIREREAREQKERAQTERERIAILVSMAIIGIGLIVIAFRGGTGSRKSFFGGGGLKVKNSERGLSAVFSG